MVIFHSYVSLPEGNSANLRYPAKKMQKKTSLVNVDNPIFKRLKDKSTHLRLNKW